MTNMEIAATMNQKAASRKSKKRMIITKGTKQMPQNVRRAYLHGPTPPPPRHTTHDQAGDQGGRRPKPRGVRRALATAVLAEERRRWSVHLVVAALVPPCNRFKAQLRKETVSAARSETSEWVTYRVRTRRGSSARTRTGSSLSRSPAPDPPDAQTSPENCPPLPHRHHRHHRLQLCSTSQHNQRMRTGEGTSLSRQARVRTVACTAGT
jgi:hypothetical protein